MINAATFIGEPSNFKNICKIYPPKVRDVVANQNLLVYLKVLTLTQEDLRDELKKKGVSNAESTTLLGFLLMSCKSNPEFYNAFTKALEGFIHEKVILLYDQKAILVGTPPENLDSINQLRIISEDDFFDLQNAIRVSVGLPELKPEPPVDPNEDPRIRKMKEKIRERDRAKAKRAAEGKGDGINITTSLTAICCMGIGLTPLNIGELSYASIAPIMKMMQEKEKYDLDIHSLLAGADSKKVKPKYWIRNFEQE